MARAPDTDHTQMKILRVADVPDTRSGGMSRTMYCTGDEFIRRGHQVDYLFAPDFRPIGPRQVRRYTDAWEAARLVKERIHGKVYDVIEMHEPLAAVYAWWRRRYRSWPPVVAFSYGLEERGREAMLAYRDGKGIPFSPVSRVTTWLSAKQAAYSVRHADWVVCSNETDVSHLIARGIPPGRITQHFSGVEKEFLEIAPSIAVDNCKRLLFLGSWLERKGILDLADAIAILFQRHSDATLTVAGTILKPQEVLATFAEDLRPRIRVISHVNGTDALIALYREHGIFVLPSYFEGQPLSLIEAAAVGLAPVVTNIGGSRDFVEDGVNGFVVPVSDGRALAGRLDLLLSNPPLVAQFGEAARRRARNQTWSASADRLLRAYVELVAREAELRKS